MASITFPNSGESQLYILCPNRFLKFQNYISNYLEYGDKITLWGDNNQRWSDLDSDPFILFPRVPYPTSL